MLYSYGKLNNFDFTRKSTSRVTSGKSFIIIHDIKSFMAIIVRVKLTIFHLSRNPSALGLWSLALAMNPVILYTDCTLYGLTLDIQPDIQPEMGGNDWKITRWALFLAKGELMMATYGYGSTHKNEFTID